MTTRNIIIQIQPVQNGEQAIYNTITLAGKYIPDPPNAHREDYSLPVGTFKLVPCNLSEARIV